jgi:hypothetical protein
MCKWSLNHPSADTDQEFKLILYLTLTHDCSLTGAAPSELDCGES